jgi:hypothetical protein
MILTVAAKVRFFTALKREEWEMQAWMRGL